MRKKIFCLSVLITVALIGSAREFWLLSNKFRFSLNEEMLIAFLEGDDFSGEPWSLSTHKIEKLELHRRSGVTDLKKSVQPAAKIKLRVKMTEAGTQMIALQSEFSLRQMEATQFNAYLRNEGFDEIAKMRTSLGSTDKPARELMARFAKILVQVGDKTDDTFKERVGLRLEIVPLQNPYLLHPGDHLDCLVLEEGKPAPHQLVKVWTKIAHSSFLQDIYTENDGTIRFPINAKGHWMVSTVRMIPSEKPGAEWQSLWASLVFAI